MKMTVKKLKKRDPALDIIRIVAVFTVISVHFFLNNGFYSETVTGVPMFIACQMRTLFSVCVPLFMILTGYLMSKKTLSRKYYSGITKTLVIYALATLVCMIYKSVVGHTPFGIAKYIKGLLDFSGANYSWYVEMYIGLFLIAPFLNLSYNSLTSKRHKQVLVATFIVLTTLPSALNIFGFRSLEWWINPTISDQFIKMVPSWWISIYPITYYFTGCYLREYTPKINAGALAISFAVAVFAFGSFNFYRSCGTTFKSDAYIWWYGFEPYLLSVCLFVFLKQIKTDDFSPGTRQFLQMVSDAALGIYLVSYVFDRIYYPILNNRITLMPDRLPYYFLIVPAVFISSAIISVILNFSAKYLIIGFNRLIGHIKSINARKTKDG